MVTFIPHLLWARRDQGSLPRGGDTGAGYGGARREGTPFDSGA